jgi:hypothetical protein
MPDVSEIIKELNERYGKGTVIGQKAATREEAISFIEACSTSRATLADRWRVGQIDFDLVTKESEFPSSKIILIKKHLKLLFDEYIEKKAQKELDKAKSLLSSCPRYVKDYFEYKLTEIDTITTIEKGGYDVVKHRRQLFPFLQKPHLDYTQFKNRQPQFFDVRDDGLVDYYLLQRCRELFKEAYEIFCPLAQTSANHIDTDFPNLKAFLSAITIEYKVEILEEGFKYRGLSKSRKKDKLIDEVLDILSVYERLIPDEIFEDEFYDYKRFKRSTYQGPLTFHVATKPGIEYEIDVLTQPYIAHLEELKVEFQQILIITTYTSTSEEQMSEETSLGDDILDKLSKLKDWKKEHFLSSESDFTMLREICTGKTKEVSKELVPNWSNQASHFTLGVLAAKFQIAKKELLKHFLFNRKGHLVRSGVDASYTAAHRFVVKLHNDKKLQSELNELA